MAAVREALARAPGLEPAEVEDLVLGCAMPEGGQGLNIARQVALGAGLPVSAAAMTVNRFCASGLQSLALATSRSSPASATSSWRAGMESMSSVPMVGRHFTPEPGAGRRWPQVYLGMGLTARGGRPRYGRRPRGPGRLGPAQRTSGPSPRRTPAGSATRSSPSSVERTVVEDGRPHLEIVRFDADEGIRRDTDESRMAGLRPVFDPTGTVTAGNSSQMSDGAAALVVMDGERAARLGLEPLGRLVSASRPRAWSPRSWASARSRPSRKRPRQGGPELDDIGVIELNEAFAAQVVAVVRRLGLDEERTNVNGGAIALGHPLGATGAKLTVQMLSELARREERYGLVTMCVGGGQGAAGVIEWLGGRQPAAAQEQIEEMEEAA